MKIATVEALPVRLPFVQAGPPIVMFGRPWTAFELVLVRIETDQGIVGYGETPWGPWRPLQALIDDFIAPALIGRPADNIAGLMHELQRLTHVIGRYGLTMFALSGVDTALWDIAGKAAGQPLARMLGGSVRPVAGYESLWVSYKRSGAWDWESADRDVLTERARAAIAAGYRHVKLHGTTEADLRAVRDAVGDDVGIMVDASCRWSLNEARQAAARLRPFGLYWLEEPVFPPEDFHSLARLQAESGIPIAAGENACTAFEFAAMFAADAVAFAQPNVNRVGGITEFRKVAALAETSGVALNPHSFFFGPGFLATLHLVAAQARPALVEKPGIPLEVGLYGGATDPINGQFHPPDGPGLGRDPDPDVLRDCRIRGA
ncbi:MAG TPA: mandelate racemase/muconate lactonizing enzyme family protein [Kofleriaceae bacterium]|nr:mandelate racemase/muconate lactonizing enzyme family protein [Kofleriaceae bacterium]